LERKKEKGRRGVREERRGDARKKEGEKETYLGVCSKRRFGQWW
jgi:hypothetical protein